MPDDVVRGSSKLMAAWKARVVSEEAFREIAAYFEKSPGRVESAEVFGGESASGVRLTVSYAGDDVPPCGNDILFWLKWHRKYGGVVKAPRIIINGTPLPDFVRLQVDFGHVASDPMPGRELGAGIDLQAGAFR